MKSRRAGPPDGGYGWVVVFSTFVIMGLTAAVLKNYGHFFLDIQTHFQVHASTTSWVTSATIAMFQIGGPAASALTIRFSQRVVIIMGGLLCTTSMVLASLDLSLPWLYLTMGIMQGMGISLSWIPALSMVSHYFARWRPIAYAIASSGECVFAVMFSPFFKWLIERYSWRGALLIIAGLQLNICVCGALMRPLATRSRSSQETKNTSEDNGVPSQRKPVFQCSLLKQREFVLYIVFAVLATAGFFIPTLFLVPFANSLGIDSYWPAFILSVLAIADLVGRLFCGWLANMRLLRNLQLLTVVTVLLGIVLLLLPVSHNYWAILVFAALFGFLFGCVVAIHITSLVDIVTLDGFDSALGLFMLFRSIGGFTGPPAGGWLVDTTKDYGSAFYLAGFCLLISAGFIILVDRLLQRKKAMEPEVHQQEAGEE